MSNLYFKQLEKIDGIPKDYLDTIKKYKKELKKIQKEDITDKSSERKIILHDLFLQNKSDDEFYDAFEKVPYDSKLEDLYNLIDYGECKNVYLQFGVNNYSTNKFKKIFLPVLLGVSLASLPIFMNVSNKIIKENKKATSEDDFTNNDDKTISSIVTKTVKEIDEEIKNQNKVSTTTQKLNSTNEPVLTQEPTPTQEITPTQEPTPTISELPTVELKEIDELNNDIIVEDKGDATVVFDGEVLNPEDTQDINSSGISVNNQLNKPVYRNNKYNKISFEDINKSSVLNFAKSLLEKLKEYGAEQIPPSLKEKCLEFCKKAKDKYQLDNEVDFTIGDDSFKGQLKLYIKNIEDKLKLGKEIYVGSKSNGLGSRIGLITSKEFISISVEEFLRIAGKTYDYKNEHSFSVSSEEKTKIK